MNFYLVTERCVVEHETPGDLRHITLTMGSEFAPPAVGSVTAEYLNSDQQLVKWTVVSVEAIIIPTGADTESFEVLTVSTRDEISFHQEERILSIGTESDD